MRFIGFLSSILNGIKAIFLGLGRLVGELVPFKRSTRLPPAVRYLVWFLLAAGVLVLLYYVNQWARIGPAVARSWAKPYFLSILGVLVMLIGIVLYWLYRLGQGDEASPFPDIDEAWREAMQALDQAGLRLPDEPLFLVLGRPQTSERNLFDAPGVEVLVKQTPANPRAPLAVFATRSAKGVAIFVTCRGASLLGRLAGILALEEMRDLEVSAEDEEVIRETMKLKPGQKITDIFKMARDKEANTLTRRALRRALGKALGPDFLGDSAEVDRLRARLGHLCRLIARDRRPFCPANGILLLVPLGATDTKQEAQQAIQACQDDLNAVRRAMKLDCSVLALVVDMEDLPGFVEFIKRAPPQNLARRVGQQFPMATRLATAEIKSEIEQSLRFVCTSYLRQQIVYPVFEIETGSGQETGKPLPDNDRLFLLLDEMTARAHLLSSILCQVVVPDEQTVLRYSGCYLAATGPKSENSVGFVAGVLDRLMDEQSRVAWTGEAKAQDAQCRTWAGYCFTLTWALALVLGVLIFYAVNRHL